MVEITEEMEAAVSKAFRNGYSENELLHAIIPLIEAAVREEDVKIAKVAWLTHPYGEIADADIMNSLCEAIAAAIRAKREGR